MTDSKVFDSLTRRGALKAAAALAVPYAVSPRVFGANSPSNRITLGCIGVGNQGLPVMQRFLANPACQVIAVCDVNEERDGYRDPKKVYGREPARKEMEENYARHVESGTFKGCDAYNDFRDIHHRDDIDAVVIAVPDHWHGIMTVMAAEAGKDIYCEKPLGLTIGDNGTVLECMTGSPDVRCEFEGTEGSVQIDSQGRQFVTIPQRLKTDHFGTDLPEIYASNDDHQRNFIDCVKSRQEPVAPVEVGHRSATVWHLGNIAIRLQANLNWDPHKEQFIGNDQANAMLHRQAKQTWNT